MNQSDYATANKAARWADWQGKAVIHLWFVVSGSCWVLRQTKSNIWIARFITFPMHLFKVSSVSCDANTIFGSTSWLSCHKQHNWHGFFQSTFRETCFKIVSLLSDVRRLGMILNFLGLASVKHEWHGCSPKLVHFTQIREFRVHGGIWWPLHFSGIAFPSIECVFSAVPPAGCHRDPSYSRGQRQFLCCLHACIFLLLHSCGKYLTWPC